MAGSDNTSYGLPGPSQGILSRLRTRLGLTPKHMSYLEDVVGALALAILFWVLYLGVGLAMP